MRSLCTIRLKNGDGSSNSGIAAAVGGFFKSIISSVGDFFKKLFS